MHEYLRHHNIKHLSSQGKDPEFSIQVEDPQIKDWLAFSKSEDEEDFEDFEASKSRYNILLENLLEKYISSIAHAPHHFDKARFAAIPKSRMRWWSPSLFMPSSINRELEEELFYISSLQNSKTDNYEIQNLICQIYDVAEDYILVNALIDKEKGIIVKRKFDKKPLEGVISIETGEIISISILTQPGERRFIYRNANIEEKNLFSLPMQDMFNKIGNSPIFKPAKSNDKDDF